MNTAQSHINDEGISALRQIVGKRIVVSIGKGRVKEGGVFFDRALIEYWPPNGHRRKRANFAVPITGTIRTLPKYGGIWIAYKISRPVKVSGRRNVLPNGRVWWSVPATFDYWPPSKKVVSRVDIFEETIKFGKSNSVITDARIEIRFEDRKVLSMEAGSAGIGFVLLGKDSKRPWRSLTSLRRRQRIN